MEKVKNEEAFDLESLALGASFEVLGNCGQKTSGKVRRNLRGNSGIGNYELSFHFILIKKRTT